jgi:regulatory protein
MPHGRARRGPLGEGGGQAGGGAPAERPDAWEAAIALLALRGYSTHELEQRLRRRGYGAEEIAAVVARLTAARYLDDAEYARAWARSRARRLSLGPVRLARELRARGVEAAHIAEALAESATEADPRALAEAAAARRLKGLQGVPAAAARRRLAAFLVRRGFATAVIIDVCRRHFPHLPETGEAE